MSLLEEQKLKAKLNSLKSNSSRSPSLPPSFSVSLNEDGTVKYNRTRKSAQRYHRSVSEQDSLPEVNGEELIRINSEETNEIPQADVHKGTVMATPSAPPASYTDDGDVDEMETLLIRSCDVDDVASLANHQSLATNYSDATTLPVRSMCPVDGVSDLLSPDTMSDNMLFPALVADIPQNQNNLSKVQTASGIRSGTSASARGGDVDICPDFGLGVPNIQQEGLDWILFENDDDFLRPPLTPSMDHIRQLLRYELPLPNLRNRPEEGESSTVQGIVPLNGQPLQRNSPRQDTEVKERFTSMVIQDDEPLRTCACWNDTGNELLVAEKDAEVVYKMASIVTFYLHAE